MKGHLAAYVRPQKAAPSLLKIPAIFTGRSRFRSHKALGPSPRGTDGSNPVPSSGESGTNRRRSAPRIDEAGWEAGASKCRRTGEPDPRCCVDGPIQGLVGLAGAFATVGIAVWVLSGTFTMTLVVPRASNSMWTW